jgi:hypothetical protein
MMVSSLGRMVDLPLVPFDFRPASAVFGSRANYSANGRWVPPEPSSGSAGLLDGAGMRRGEMRAIRGFAMAVVIAAVLIPAPSARADGGAYVDLDRTHYLPGDSAVGVAYVSVPRSAQARLDRGPFYAFVVPKGSSVSEGKPIPDGVIRVGTFSIERSRGASFELRVSFTVPDLPGDFYSIALCNDPCTVSGFREPISGFLSIVATAREGQLLTERSRLEGRIYGLRRDVRKSDRAMEELQGRLDAGEMERSRLYGDIVQLRSSLAAATARATRAEEPGARPFVATSAAVLLGIALLAVAAAIATRRRRIAPIAVPDTIEELVPQANAVER